MMIDDEKPNPSPEAALEHPEPTPAVPHGAEERKPTTLPQYSFQNLPDDKFSKGRVVKYFPQSRYGFIKDRKGRDLYFNIDEIRFAGTKGREALKEGVVVGYDVAWTSHGLHIAKIKVY